MSIFSEFNISEHESPTIYGIITELLKNGSMSRKQLCRNLDKPRTTVFDNLNRLQKRNIVSKFAKNNGDKGRPQIFWKIIRMGSNE